MNLEKVALPRFNGDVRTFPRFINDLQKLAVPNIPKVQLPLALRQSLPP